MTQDAKKSTWRRYLDLLIASAKTCDRDKFTQLIEKRLRGDHESSVEIEEQRIVSPRLDGEEYDENQIIVYAYQALKKENSVKGMECIRGTVTGLLENIFRQETCDLRYMDELGYLTASLDIEESPELADNLRKVAWARLEGFGQLEQLITFDEALEYIHRIFDIWLIVAKDVEPQKLSSLFSTNLVCVENQSIRPTHFKFLLLVFRALVKFDREFAGRIALFELCQKFEQENQEALTRSFYSLCWEMGILIRRTEGWLESFVKGLDAIPDDARNKALQSPIFIQALSRMKISESQLPVDIGFVLAFNRVENRLISQLKAEKMQQKRYNELNRLNKEGIVVALFRIWNSACSLGLFQRTQITNILENFIGNYIISDKQKIRLFHRDEGYRFAEEKEFLDFLEKVWRTENLEKEIDNISSSSNSSEIYYQPSRPVVDQRVEETEFLIVISPTLNEQKSLSLKSQKKSPPTVEMNGTKKQKFGKYIYDNRQQSNPKSLRRAAQF